MALVFALAWNQQASIGRLPNTLPPEKTPIESPLPPYFPSLEEFTEIVKDGTDSIRGVWADDVFALRVVPQPEGNEYFVSPYKGYATLFQGATKQGSIGLSAHNTLSGSEFYELEEGRGVYIILGNGTVQAFKVQDFKQYQAVSPNNPASDLIDLDTGKRLSAGRVRYEVYEQDGRLILATCIKKDGNWQWGRYFVIADPITSFQESRFPED